MQDVIFNTIDEAVIDLKLGKMIIVCDDESRENEGDFVALAEFITPEAINFMVTNGGGLICVPLTNEYADRLALTPMVVNNTDKFSTGFTVSIDHISSFTGISVHDRALTIKKILDKDVKSTDFSRPGHVFPLLAKSGGVLERMGHTESAVDLAKLCNSKPVGVICEILNPDGTMARVSELSQIADKFNLKMITVKDLIHYRKYHETLIVREAEAKLPTVFGEFTIFGYSNVVDDKEHIAVMKGNIHENKVDKLPLVRVHSECLTGDVFYSLRCDCREQLHNALKVIEKYGFGVVLYLRQEGRGIGLINKLKAYVLQQDGLDTVEANNELGFANDAREYWIAAQILKDLGLTKVKLITNNPSKIEELEAYGIEVVERIHYPSTHNSENAEYLATKTKKFGHFL